MCTVALIGPDGVGKTSVARHLERTSALPLKYLYMGDNIESSNVALPTTRWWKRRQARAARRAVLPGAAAGPDSRGGGALRRGLRTGRKTLGFCNRVLEESYRALVAQWYERRGYIVLFDRHFLWDYWHHDIAPAAGRRRSLGRRLHGLLMRRIHRPPDLVICLDAPGETVYRRKGEFTPEHLESRRAQYLELRRVIPHFAVVDAQRPLDAVVGDVGGLIDAFHREAAHARS